MLGDEMRQKDQQQNFSPFLLFLWFFTSGTLFFYCWCHFLKPSRFPNTRTYKLRRPAPCLLPNFLLKLFSGEERRSKDTKVPGCIFQNSRKFNFFCHSEFPGKKFYPPFLPGRRLPTFLSPPPYNLGEDGVCQKKLLFSPFSPGKRLHTRSYFFLREKKVVGFCQEITPLGLLLLLLASVRREKERQRERRRWKRRRTKPDVSLGDNHIFCRLQAQSTLTKHAVCAKKEWLLQLYRICHQVQ